MLKRRALIGVLSPCAHRHKLVKTDKNHPLFNLVAPLLSSAHVSKETSELQKVFSEIKRLKGQNS